MKRFEYKTITVDAKGFWGGKVNSEKFEAMLNKLGAHGWELVQTAASNQSYGSTRYLICVFKRETL